MYCGAEGHELHREGPGIHENFCVCLSVLLTFLSPLPCWIHCWYVNNRKHILRPDRLPWVSEHTPQHTNTHISAASAAPEECFFHRWCEKIWCFHSDTLMKLSALPPPRHPLLCISISDIVLFSSSPLFQLISNTPVIALSPSPLLSFYHPLLLASFSVSLSTAMVATPSSTPNAATTSKLVFPHSSALRSLQQLSPVAFFSLL